MSADKPSTPAELLAYCRRYEADIYVGRHDDAGKWCAISLAELNYDAWGEKVWGFVERGAVPVRSRREGEP